MHLEFRSLSLFAYDSILAIIRLTRGTGILKRASKHRPGDLVNERYMPQTSKDNELMPGFETVVPIPQKDL
jgi:hypothetical protein